MHLKFRLLVCLGFVFSCSSRPKMESQKTTPSPVQVKNSKAPTTHPGHRPMAPMEPSNAPITADSSSRAQELERSGRYPEALKEFVELSVSSPNKQNQEYYRLKALEIVENRLRDEELDSVADSSDYGFVRGHALFKLGEMSFQRRDTSAARRYFSSVISYLPESDLASQAQEYISQIESVRIVESKTIGVILPLSGKNAPVGQRALRSIQMGLELNESDSRFKLAVMDSEGNPDTARRAVERLVKEDHVIAIIGGLLSKTASSEVSKADELGVPSLVLSQKAGITDVGPFVFRNALTSEMLVHHLVQVAMNDQGMKRFAVIYPNDPYGVEYANIFWDEVLARGGSIVSAQSYSPKETDFRGAIQRLVGTFYIEARIDEFRNRTKDLKKNEKSIRQENRMDDILPPITDFDAIFVPDNAKTLGQISAFLSYSGVKGVKLLGTNLWNNAGIFKRSGHFASNLLFVDGIHPASEGFQKNAFVQEYKTLFSEDPSLIEIQAYDSALILRQIILSGASSREELSRRLVELEKFPGSIGALDMAKNREILRPVVALTLNKDGQVVPAASEGNP